MFRINWTCAHFLSLTHWKKVGSEGTITFNLSDSSLISSSFRGGEEHAVELPTVRLSDFIDEPVNLLKLDIEGAEGFVLQDLVERENFA